MPIESAPIVFAATDLEFGCLCYLSLDWAGLLTSDATMTLLDAWAWSEIATISEKKGGGGLLGSLRSASSHARCTVKLEMVGGRRKNVRLKDASDLRRFFHTVARFTPTEKVGGRRRTLWRQRRALRLLHTHAPSQGLPNGTGTLPPSSAAAVARLSPDRAALEVPSSSGGRGSRNGSTHQRWPIVEEEEEEVEEEENGEVNPGTSSSFIVRLPATASRAPSYATLLRKQKQKQNQEQEEEEEKSKSSSSSEGGISERGKRLSLSTRSVVSTETQTSECFLYPFFLSSLKLKLKMFVFTCVFSKHLGCGLPAAASTATAPFALPNAQLSTTTTSAEEEGRHYFSAEVSSASGSGPMPAPGEPPR